MFVKNTVVNIGSFHIVPTQTIAVIARKRKHKHIQKESGPAARNSSTPRHTGRGLAGYLCQTGIWDNKTRLYTSIRSETPAIWQRSLHTGSAQQRSRPAHRSDEFAGERSRGNSFTSSERVRLLQPSLACPQEGWWSKTHSRSPTPESCPFETAF